MEIIIKATPCCSGQCDNITKRCSPVLPPNCSLPTEFVAKTPTFNVQEMVVSNSDPLNFDVTILTSSISSLYVPNKDLQGCAMEGSQWANFLVTTIKVSNIGPTNYQILAQQLEQTDCGTISSFMNMYSVDFPGGPYFKFERCLSDTTEPKIFNCSNMGLSTGNFHTTTLWIEISDTVATSLSTAGEYVTVHFLPLDTDSKATSSPYPVPIMSLPTNKFMPKSSELFKGEVYNQGTELSQAKKSEEKRRLTWKTSVSLMSKASVTFMFNAATQFMPEKSLIFKARVSVVVTQ